MTAAADTKGSDPLGDLLRDLIRAEEALVRWADGRRATFEALARLRERRPDDGQLVAIEAQLRAVTDQQHALAEQLRALQRQVLAVDENASVGPAPAAPGGESGGGYRPLSGGRY